MRLSSRARNGAWWAVALKSPARMIGPEHCVRNSVEFGELIASGPDARKGLESVHSDDRGLSARRFDCRSRHSEAVGLSHSAVLGLQGEVVAVLSPPGPRLSEEKTLVVGIDEGFDFLGFRIQRQTKRESNRTIV